ncbi:hypothetical protein [Natrinema versiforme]|uniref:Right-handed parallel beta-helix repeat-containing protein n=1 Tax=Natrinema versiforme TaxID=88724 RepID=A0A4P8WIK1_9EURY|nr:hypothetical protein [Natrinema versiforme]QCS42892.1 hypothetical protein FEJ81_11180 [Natrinema versiforme]
MTSNESLNRRYRRRSYLKGCLVGLGTAVSAGGVVSATDSENDREDEYETVVDVVEAGADDSGSESVTPVLREHVDDDTLLEFPEGRYYMDEQLRLTSFENVGFVGEDATLVPATYREFDGPQYRLFRMGTSDAPGRDLRFEGFHVDQTASETGIRVLSAQVEDGLVVTNVFVDGVHDSGTWGPGLFNVTDPDGSGRVERFCASDGGRHVDETPNAGTMWRGPTGISVDQHHRGTLVFDGCVLGGFPDNGLYVSSETGRVGVDGGRFRNSGTASIRLSGTAGEIRDATITVDENPHDSRGQHAIRLDRGGRFELEGVTVDAPRPNGDAIRVMNDVERASIADSRIAVGDRPNSGIRIDPGVGSATIEDIDIEIDGSGNAVRILGPDATGVDLEDVRITGDAAGTTLRHAIFCERSECRFVGLSVDQRGPDKRRGLELRGDDATVADSEFETTHTPIVVNGADGVAIEDTRAASAGDGYSLRIIDDSGAVSLAANEFPDGVRDDR